MKRGRDVEEKVMSPMFPRLHINDKEQGGPRAPPRNKMALYEQLTIPCSQRLNTAKTNHTIPSLVPPSSSSQGSVGATGVYFSLKQKKVDEEDFRVPVFEHLEEIMASRKQPVKYVSNPSATKTTVGPLKQSNAFGNKDHRDQQTTNLKRLENTNASVQPKYIEGLHPENTARDDGITNERMRGISLVVSRGEFHQKEYLTPGNTVHISEAREDRTRGLLPVEVDDDVSEASMVDNELGVDISPDDVVGIIGQKHFWKARRAIVDQQKVFAVQVFELHRLIKVQRLIAESPHVLLEANAYLSEPLTVSPATKTKRPLDCIVELPPRIVKQNIATDKPNRKMECSAENEVRQTTISSVGNCGQPPQYRPYTENPPPMPIAIDNGMTPWGFHQSPGHQWLMPVMSPSEGLIYKPCYPGGYGPPGSTQVGSNFFNQSLPYVVPPYQYQGMGHGYSPPQYGMPVMSQAVPGPVMQQRNNSAGLDPRVYIQSSGLDPRVYIQSSGEGANFNTQHHSSSSVPSQKNGATLDAAVKLQAPKASKVQGSTARSLGERAPRVGSGNTTEGRNVPPLDTDLPARVIRVVPRNAGSASQSAAWIFQSIQEERKQLDSV